MRKITIENKIYLYTISDKYDNGNNTLTLKVFLTGHKAYPLTINFFTWSNKKTGDPLNVITTLINAKTRQNEDIINHRPKYVREVILQAIKQGWTENKAEIFDGIDLLNAIGFEADTLRPYSNPQKMLVAG